MDLLSNPGVELIAPQTGEMHSLPYSPEDDPPEITKREPFSFKKFSSSVRKVATKVTSVVKKTF